MEDQIKQHEIWNTMQQFAALKGNQAFVDSAEDQQISWYVQRLFQFVSITDLRLRQAPTTLLSLSVLNNLQAVLASALNEANNFVANKNVAHLSSAVSTVDSTGFIYLSQIPEVAPTTSDTDLGKLADDYRNQVQGIVKSLFDDRKRLQTEIETLRLQVSNVVQQATELTQNIANQKAEVSVAIQQLQTTYSAKEQEFSKSFETQLATQESTFSGAMAKADSESKADRAAIAERAQELLRVMEEDRTKAAKIVGIIGNIGVTGNYQKSAELEGRAANQWRWITLGAFSVSVAVGIWALHAAHEVDLKLTISRVLFAFLVLGVTVYTGRESARHRSNGDRAKRIELELASLGPFIESLTKVDQDALRKGLTDRYFGKEMEPHVVEPLLKPSDAVDLLKTAITAAKR